MLRRVWVVVLLGAAGVLSACVHLDPHVESQPVWSSDGGIYYLRSGFDAPDELWRMTPEGERRRVREILPPGAVGCDGTDYLANARLFAWPSGRAGMELYCGGNSYYLGIQPDQQSFALVSTLPGGSVVVWADEGRDGMAYTSSCLGFERVADGHRSPVAPPVVINATPVDANDDGPRVSCRPAGVGVAPVTAHDDFRLAFLFAAGAATRANAFRGPTSWQVYVWRNGAPAPTALGPRIQDAADLAYSGTAHRFAIGTGRLAANQITVVDGTSGAVQLTIGKAGEPSFSPDGHRVAYASDERCHCVEVSSIP